MTSKAQLIEDNKNLHMIVSKMGEMLSRSDDELSKIKAKMSRPRYRNTPKNFEVKVVNHADGNYVTVGDMFELYETESKTWTVRLIGIGFNQYQAFADLIPVSVQIDAISKLIEANK